MWAHSWRLGWDSQNLLLLPEASGEVMRGLVLDRQGWALLQHSDGQESVRGLRPGRVRNRAGRRGVG